MAKNTPQNNKLRELHHLAAYNSVAQPTGKVTRGFGKVDNNTDFITQRPLQKSRKKIQEPKKRIQPKTLSLSEELNNTAHDYHRIDLSNAKVDHGTRGVVQRVGIANVVLEEDDRGLYVDSILFHERVPTDARGGGQGDHTVAEALIEGSFKALTGRSIKGYLKGLYDINQGHLEGTESAQHTPAGGKDRFPITPTDVGQEIERYIKGWEDVYASGSLYYLTDITTQVWRLLSKRTDTAFARAEGITTGGGSGTGEREAMKELEALREKVPNDWHRNDEFIEHVADILLGLVDVKPKTLPKKRLQTILWRAAHHAADVLKIINTDWMNKVANKMAKHIPPADEGPVWAPATIGEGSKAVRSTPY